MLLMRLKQLQKAKKKEMERKVGCRYSELLRLPYYDCIRFVIIDPMHNLLLGTAKHMFQTWTDKGILKPKDLKEIQDYIDHTVVPQMLEEYQTNSKQVRVV